MLNHIDVAGRLVRDPELHQTPSGVAVANFRIASDRDFKDKETGERQTDFIDVVAWRKTGEFVSKYCRKGNLVTVSGRLQMRNYADKDGNKRTAAEILADSIYLSESKKNDAECTDDPTETAPETTNDQYTQIDPDEGELPF